MPGLRNKTRPRLPMKSLHSRTFALVLAIALLIAVPARADEIKVMTSGAFTEAYQQLVEQFQKATRHTVVTTFGASMGGAKDSIPVRLGRGEPVDVVIVIESAFEPLIKGGYIDPQSRVQIARSVIGVAVRKGAPKPDISSVAALRQTLLQAKSIAYSASASGTYISTEMFARLGIADQVKGKAKRIKDLKKLRRDAGGSARRHQATTVPACASSGQTSFAFLIGRLRTGLPVAA